MRSTVLFIAVMGALSGCKDESHEVTTADGSVEQPDGSTPIMPDGGTPDGTVEQPTTGLVRLEAFGNDELTAVASLNGVAIVGTKHGLFRASAPSFALESIGRDWPGLMRVADVINHNGTLFAMGDDMNGGHMYFSTDEGANWQVVFSSSDVFLYGGEGSFASNGEQLVVLTSGRLFAYNASRNMLDPISVVIDGEEVPQAITAVDLYGDTLTIDFSIYSSAVTGLHQANVADGFSDLTWSGIGQSPGGSALAFAHLGDALIVGDNTGLHVVTGGDAPSDLYAAGRVDDILIRGDVVTIASEGGLRRTSNIHDASAWETIASAEASQSRALAADDAGAFWIGNALYSADNVGASWTRRAANIAVAERLAVVGGNVYAAYGTSLFGADSTMDTFSVLHAGGLYATAATATHLWICDSSSRACQRINVATGARQNMPHPFPENAWGLRTNYPLIALGEDLFAYQTFTVARCGGDADPHLVSSGDLRRFDATTSTWRDANNGLPTLGCEGFDSLRTASDIFVANGALYTSLDEHTYRSTDRGATWRVVEGIGASRTGVGCGDAVLLALNDQTFARSTDGGATFSVVANCMPSTLLTSAVEVGDQCYLGFSDASLGSSLFVSPDGELMTPFEGAFIEPIQSLATDGATLAVATYTSGVYRARLSE